MKRHWLNDGSLFILMPETLLPFWGNFDADYDRARQISNSWLTTIKIATGTGLLLGGDPAMATFTRDYEDHLLLVRWIHADKENDLLEFARQDKYLVTEDTPVYITNTNLDWALFDAAGNPDNLADTPEVLRVEIPLGALKIQSRYLKQGANAAIVHKFSKYT